MINTGNKMSIIKTLDLTKIYDQETIPVKAVDNVSLEFSEGEFSAIIGPSGCGKTTLLNLIGGLDAPTSGEVIVNGTNITQLNSKEIIDFRLKNIGFVNRIEIGIDEFCGFVINTKRGI